MSGKVLVAIDKIDFAGSFQARENGVDPNKVDEYAASLDAGDETPPVDLYRLVISGEVAYLIADGHTRVKAHQKLGRGLIWAKVHEGGREAALLHAVRANTIKTHGVLRTQADARKAIKLFLTEGDWYKRSDREVGRACEVDHKTVGTVREQLEDAGTIPRVQQRLGADGRSQKSHRETSLGNSPVEEKEETQPDFFITSKPPTPKTPAPKCGVEPCIRKAYGDGVYCTEHTPKEKKSDEPGSLSADGLPATLLGQEASSVSAALAENAGLSAPEVVAESQSGSALGSHSGDTPLVEASGEGKQILPGESASSGSPSQGVTSRQIVAEFLKAKAPPKEEAATSAESSALVYRKARALCPLCQAAGRPPGARSGCELCHGSGYFEAQVIREEREPGYPHHNTPAWLRDICLQVGPIALDPCSNPWSILNAAVAFDAETNGLEKDWLLESKGGLIVINPPYDACPVWAAKILLEAKRGCEMIIIVPTAHSAQWWQEVARAAQVIALMNARVIFTREGKPNGSPRWETNCIYLGSRADLFCRAFGPVAYLTRQIPEEVYRGVYLDKPSPRQEGLPFPVTPKEQTFTEKIECLRLSVTWEEASKRHEEIFISLDIGMDEEIDQLDTTWREVKERLSAEIKARKTPPNTQATPAKEEPQAVEIPEPIISLKEKPEPEEEDPAEKRIKHCNTTPCGDCGRFSLEVKHFFGLDAKGEELCRECAAKKEAEAATFFHASLKKVSKEYQQDGYEVSISTPRSEKRRSVMGTLSALMDRQCLVKSAVRDENEDLYTIDFCDLYHDSREGNVICTLYAKKDAKPESETGDPGVWVSRAVYQLEAIQPKEAFEPLYKKLLGEASPEEKKALRAEMPKIREKREEIEKAVLPQTCSKCLAVNDLTDCGPVMGQRCPKHLPETAKKKEKPITSSLRKKAPKPNRVKGKNEEKNKKWRGK